MTKPLTDVELLRRAKAGDLGGFEELVTRHECRIYTLVKRMLRNEQDAEDVTQQAFLSAIEHLKDFREEASFATWITRIATYAALKVIRKRKGLPTVSLEQNIEETDEEGRIPHPEYVADWRESPELLVQRNETQRLLDEALDDLEEKHRLVFLLRDVEGLSVKETAEALSLSESNVKVKLFRARMHLREKLTQVFGDKTTRVKPAHKHP